MKRKPLVSVLMTAYNRETYIAEAIESVLSSTYTNFELLIVDDASSDSTVSIAQAYQCADPRVQVYVNKTNQGQFANRNTAASYAKGTILKYVDSDDKLYPYTLEMMVNSMNKFPEAGLGFCLTHGPCKKPLPYLIEPREALFQHFFEGGLLFVGPSGLIIRKDVFERVGGFEQFGMPSDNHFALKVAAKYPVVAMTRDLFWWRLHPGQVFSQNLGNHRNILNNYAYTRSIIKHHSPLTSVENKKALNNQKKIFFINVLKLAFLKHQPLKALDLLIQRRKALAKN